jgi:hypothetical protein
LAKSGLKHIDVGAELTKTEWESEESHEVVHGTSFPSSPVERQLFYRDDEHKWYIYNGSEWVWLGGGSGGGMQIHGNEYHDPDFASEAALASHASATTGVHGVGAGTIAKVADIAVDSNLSAAAQDAIAKRHTQGTDTALGAVGTKNPPIDADKALYRNSESSDALVTSTWSQIKSFLKTYFDTLYAKSQIILHVYLYNGGTNQQLPSDKNVVVMLDTEVSDSESAFDSSVKAGAATATSAGHLIDTTLNPFVAGDVGRKVWNTTDDTYTYITAYNSASDVSVNDNIFTSGEGYKAYFAKFVAPAAMEVVVFTKVDVRYLADGKYLQAQVLKNGSPEVSELRYFSGASQLGLINMSAPIILATNDSLQLELAHNIGSKQYINSSGGATWMKIVKLRNL